LSPKELRKALDDLGLKAISTHIAPEPAGKVLEECRALGMNMAVCGYDPGKMKTIEGVREAARFLNSAGENLRKGGVTLCYHNHNWEFEKVDGKLVLDWLYELSDPQNLKAQLDVYWIKRGGPDPVSYTRSSARVARCFI